MTSFPKAGSHSAGVPRQYGGAPGKKANCQIAVSLHHAEAAAATSRPLCWRLFLPEGWAEDLPRCPRAGVPPGIAHQSKLDLAPGRDRPGAGLEQDHRELKDEPGRDHFEARSWLGFHHHLALVTAAFVFLRQEQARLRRRAQKKPARTYPPAGAPQPPSHPHPPGAVVARGVTPASSHLNLPDAVLLESQAALPRAMV